MSKTKTNKKLRLFIASDDVVYVHPLLGNEPTGINSINKYQYMILYCTKGKRYCIPYFKAASAIFYYNTNVNIIPVHHKEDCFALKTQVL